MSKIEREITTEIFKDNLYKRKRKIIQEYKMVLLRNEYIYSHMTTLVIQQIAKEGKIS